MQPHPNLLQTVTEGRNNGIKTRDHERYESQMRRFSNIEALLYLVPFMLQLTGRCILRLFLIIIIGLARSIHGTQRTAITMSSLWNTCWKQKYKAQWVKWDHKKRDWICSRNKIKICQKLHTQEAQHTQICKCEQSTDLTLRLLMSYIYIYIYIWSTYSWCF